MSDTDAAPAVDPERAPAPAAGAAPAADPAPRDTTGLTVGAVVAAVVGVGLWAAARNSAIALVAVVAAVQAALLVSWIVGLRVPGRFGGLAVCGLAAAGTDVLTVLYPHSQLGVLVPPLGLLVLAIFVAQLTRGVVRVRVVESVSDVALLGVAVVALGALVQLRHAEPAVPDLRTASVALVIGAALVVSALADLAVPFPRFDPTVDRGLVAVLLGAAAAAGVGYLTLRGTFGYGAARGTFLGAALGIVVCLIAVGAAFARHRPAVPAAPGAAPAVAAPAGDSAAGDSADGDSAAGDSPAGDAGTDDPEVVLEADAVTRRPSPWPDRLPPVATVLWTFAISAPVGYLLTLALGG